MSLRINITKKTEKPKWEELTPEMKKAFAVIAKAVNRYIKDYQREAIEILKTWVNSISREKKSFLNTLDVSSISNDEIIKKVIIPILDSSYEFDKSTIWIFGLPFKFEIKTFIKQYAQYAYKVDMEKVLRTFQVPEGTITRYIPEFKDLFKKTDTEQLESKLEKFAKLNCVEFEHRFPVDVLVEKLNTPKADLIEVACKMKKNFNAENDREIPKNIFVYHKHNGELIYFPNGTP